MRGHDHFLYCRESVRAHDPERFFLSLFAPRRVRPYLWALYALNHEIAKTREVVSETQLGLIRLQWWREEIAKIYDGLSPSNNEILKALAETIDAYTLPQDQFEAMIYGREFDLEDVLPTNYEGTMAYIENTNLPLMGLVCDVLGVEDREAAKMVAMNYGLVGLLRAVPFHASQQRCYLPENALIEAGVNPYSLYKGKLTEKMPSIIKTLYDKFKVIHPNHKHLKAIHIWADIHRKHIRDHDYDVFKMAQSPPPPFRELRCYFKSII